MSAGNNTKEGIKMTKCACGRRMSKYAAGGRCGRCHDKRMAELKAAAAAVVSKGSCPDCGGALKNNLALTGWWQCTNKCGWQAFTA